MNEVYYSFHNVESYVWAVLGGNKKIYPLQGDRQGHFGADPLDDLGGNGSLDQILTKASIMVLMKMIILWG